LLTADVVLHRAVNKCSVSPFRLRHRSEINSHPSGGEWLALSREFQIAKHDFASAFATISTLLVAAEGSVGVEGVRGVDPDYPRLDASGKLRCSVDILRPNGGRQAVGCIIGEIDRLIDRPERHGNGDGAKDLHLRDGRRWLRIGN